MNFVTIVCLTTDNKFCCFDAAVTVVSLCYITVHVPEAGVTASAVHVCVCTNVSGSLLKHVGKLGGGKLHVRMQRSPAPASNLRLGGAEVAVHFRAVEYRVSQLLRHNLCNTVRNAENNHVGLMLTSLVEYLGKLMEKKQV